MRHSQPSTASPLSFSPCRAVEDKGSSARRLAVDISFTCCFGTQEGGDWINVSLFVHGRPTNRRALVAPFVQKNCGDECRPRKPLNDAGPSQLQSVRYQPMQELLIEGSWGLSPPNPRLRNGPSRKAGKAVDITLPLATAPRIVARVHCLRRLGEGSAWPSPETQSLPSQPGDSQYACPNGWEHELVRFLFFFFQTVESLPRVRTRQRKAGARAPSSMQVEHGPATSVVRVPHSPGLRAVPKSGNVTVGSPLKRVSRQRCAETTDNGGGTTEVLCAWHATSRGATPGPPHFAAAVLILTWPESGVVPFLVLLAVPRPLSPVLL